MPLAQNAGLYLPEVLRGGIYYRGLNECQHSNWREADQSYSRKVQYDGRVQRHLASRCGVRAR
jgi:hypothetical protein